MLNLEIQVQRFQFRNGKMEVGSKQNLEQNLIICRMIREQKMARLTSDSPNSSHVFYMFPWLPLDNTPFFGTLEWKFVDKIKKIDEK